MISKKNNWVLPLHFAATFAMTGLFVFVHFVHYQLFRFVAPDRFVEFHNNHIMEFAPIIGLLMTIELLTGLALFMMRQDWLWISNFVLIVITWIMTGYWQGPMHVQLGKVYDAALIEQLISTDIWRVLVWVLHAGLVLFAMMKPDYNKLFK